MAGLRNLADPESRKFWEFVDNSTGLVQGTLKCPEHGYQANTGAEPTHACKQCWRQYFDFHTFNPGWSK